MASPRTQPAVITAEEADKIIQEYQQKHPKPSTKPDLTYYPKLKSAILSER